jgi:hypothetical protein
MTLLRLYPIQITIVFFAISLIVEFVFHNSSTLSLLAAAFGSIFVALKYRLDQANYHKELFKQRFEIYMLIDNNLRAWAGDFKADQKLLDQLNEVLRASYFLFSKETYDFIKEVRKALIFSRVPGNEWSREFLVKLVDEENLPSKFPELKIDNY